MKLETIATHLGYDNKDSFGAMAVPIYQTTAYNFFTTKIAADRFALREVGQIYSRLTNPTTDVLEARVAAMEQGRAAIAVSSGQAAMFAAIANLAKSGENIIISKKLYGGTTSLCVHTLKRFGIETRLFDSDSADDLEAKIDDKSRAIIYETLSNPQLAVGNTDKIAQISNKYGVISIADNTVATPVLYNPLSHGIDVVVHSASKYISGHGLSIAGIVISSNELNDKLKGNKRYSHFNSPDESYHGLIYAELPFDTFDIFTLRIRLSILRDFGITLSPFNSFQLIQGLETLSVRVKEHSKSALKVAEFLQSHPKVKSVNYPGLKGSKEYERIKRDFKDGMASGLLCFEVESFDFAKQILDRVKIFNIVVNIGDTKSVITHPASTTHQQLSKEELAAANIDEGLIRLSVGLENVDDLIDDLKGAMK